MNPAHPKIVFAILLKDLENKDAIASDFEKAINTLSSNSKWVIQAPQMIDHVDEQEDGSSVHSYGVFMEQYSAYPPYDKEIPAFIDRLHYKETAALMAAITPLSAAHKCSFSVYYNNDQIGQISLGEIHKNITEGLMEAWDESLKAKGA